MRATYVDDDEQLCNVDSAFYVIILIFPHR